MTGSNLTLRCSEPAEDRTRALLVGNGTPGDRIEPLAEFASHFHVRGAANGRLQASFKDNVIDYKRVVDTLDEAGYSGYIGLEYVWIDWEHCNECDNLSETILYRDFFRGL